MSLLRVTMWHFLRNLINVVVGKINVMVGTTDLLTLDCFDTMQYTKYYPFCPVLMFAIPCDWATSCRTGGFLCKRHDVKTIESWNINKRHDPNKRHDVKKCKKLIKVMTLIRAKWCEFFPQKNSRYVTTIRHRRVEYFIKNN